MMARTRTRTIRSNVPNNVRFPSTRPRQRLMLEPSAMASRLIRGFPDPPDTPDRAVFTRALMGTLSAFNNNPATQITTLTGAAILSYENLIAGGTYAPRFREVRVKRVEVWDSSASVGSSSSDTPLILTISAPDSDHAVFRDFPVAGHSRSHIAVIPTFELRSIWIGSTSSDALFTITGQGTTSATNSPIVRLTVELR